MAENNKQVKDTSQVISDPKNAERRKAVKTIVGGVGALAAYHVMPTNWSKPLIEQVFLPAHAAASGASLVDPCWVHLVKGSRTTPTVVVYVTGEVTPPIQGVAIEIVVTTVGGSGAPVTVNTTTVDDGTYTTKNIPLTGGPGIRRVIANVTATSGGLTAKTSCYLELKAPPRPTTSGRPTPPPMTTPFTTPPA